MDGSGGELTLTVVEDGSEGFAEANAQPSTYEASPDGHDSEDERHYPPEKIPQNGVDQDGKTVAPLRLALDDDEAVGVVEIPRHDPDVN